MTQSDVLPEYMESDTQRKCRRCDDSKNWERSRTYAKVTRCVNGVTTSRMVRTDAATFKCLSCGYEVSS